MKNQANRDLVRQLCLQAEGLVEDQHGIAPPVRLAPIAKKQKVSEVKFQWLYSDAILTTHEHGFRIFCHSAEVDTKWLDKVYAEEKAGRLLPNRIRFSIAHEIAHTLFFDLTPSRPIESAHIRAGGGRTALENLETYCNQIAGHILMPRSLFQIAIKRMNGLTAIGIFNLSQEFGTSIASVLLRLQEEEQFLCSLECRGCALVVTESPDKDLTVHNIMRTTGDLADSLRDLRWNKPFRVMTDKKSEATIIGRETPFTLELPLTTGRSFVRSYRVSAMELASHKKARFHLIAFDELPSDPQPPSSSISDLRLFDHKARGTSGKGT